MNGFRLYLVPVCCVLFAAGIAAQERIADPEGLISIVPLATWNAASSDLANELIDSRPNTFSRVIGPQRDRQGVLLLKVDEPADLIPNLQLSVYAKGGLPLDDASMEVLERELESIYARSTGGPFRMFVLERSEVAGLAAFRLTGVYRWRTNNIKILQYLVPGAGHLYAITYTANEREFNRHLPAVEQMLSTIHIADPPLFTGWLWDALRWVLLLVLVAAILWGILYANSIKPGGQGPRFTLFGFLRRAVTGSEQSANPFMRKR